MTPAALAPLAVILPGPAETSLLRACLLSGEAGRQAWEAYRARVGDPRQGLGRGRGGVKALAPLLLAGLRRNGIVADPAAVTYLRTAYLRETLRSRAYREIVATVLAAVERAGIPALTLGDAAVSETVYDEPALHHCGDIVLLVDEVDLAQTGRLLAPLGLAPSPGAPAGTGALRLEHASGVGLRIETRLVRPDYYSLPVAEARSRSERRVIAGVMSRVLSPADTLLHVCVRAAGDRARASLRWAADAWLVVDRSPDLDWSGLLDTVERGRLALPALVTLEYLTGGLDAPIPARALERLRAAALATDGRGYEVALAGARAGSLRDGARMVRLGQNWRVRADVTRRLLLPSRAHMRESFPGVASWAWPVCYAVRPLRALARGAPLAWTRKGGRRGVRV